MDENPTLSYHNLHSIFIHPTADKEFEISNQEETVLLKIQEGIRESILLPHPTPSYTGYYCHPTPSHRILPWILLPSYPILHCILLPSYHILPRPTLDSSILPHPTPSYLGLGLGLGLRLALSYTVFYCHPTTGLFCHPTLSYLSTTFFVLHW